MIYFLSSRSRINHYNFLCYSPFWYLNIYIKHLLSKAFSLSYLIPLVQENLVLLRAALCIKKKKSKNKKLLFLIKLQICLLIWASGLHKTNLVCHSCVSPLNISRYLWSAIFLWCRNTEYSVSVHPFCFDCNKKSYLCFFFLEHVLYTVLVVFNIDVFVFLF